MKYSKLTLGQIEAIANKLGGEQGITDFLSGKTKVVYLESVKESIDKNYFFDPEKNKLFDFHFGWYFSDIFLPLVDDFFETAKQPLRYKSFEKDLLFPVINKEIPSLLKNPTQIAREIYEVVTSTGSEFHPWNNWWFYEYEGEVWHVICTYSEDYKEWIYSSQKHIGLIEGGSRVFY